MPFLIAVFHVFLCSYCFIDGKISVMSMYINFYVLSFKIIVHLFTSDSFVFLSAAFLFLCYVLYIDDFVSVCSVISVETILSAVMPRISHY